MPKPVTETMAYYFRDPLTLSSTTPDAKPTVLVIDDDPDLRASVGRLLQSVGLKTQLFASSSDFLKSDPPDGPACLVLDVRLPGQSGLDFQRELAAANRELPDHLHYRARGHPDVGASNEGGRD
jgi:FixJ family two-component response regulator